MKSTTKKTIVSVLEIILKAITFLACVALTTALMCMVESWSIEGAPLIVAIVSLVWLVKIGLYTYLINK